MAMELATGGGVVGGSGGDDHQEPSDPNRDKKRYHEQIQLLAITFRECPHPDEKDVIAKGGLGIAKVGLRINKKLDCKRVMRLCLS
ncbi:hypothetical protein L6452_35719 [Arctium lappa]|uniref:Uncharacterized protein n=1 Tax=Arctium lappa TaxID=4217 RepID=A0ACB8Y7V2_ARCLA|nr:hypothetical protein L6452_35719 [Arctium lappa]